MAIFVIDMECPRCRTESSGRFCPECGAPLTPTRCGSCGADLPPDARYCTRCGESVAGPGRGAAVAWTATAVLVGLVLVVFVLPALRGGPQATMAPGNPPASTGAGAPAAASPVGAPAPGPGSAPAGTPPPLTGTPREQADRLFNRVMEAFAAGDSANGRFFLPMAIEAYRMVAPLDADGHFHLSLLHTAAGDPAAGLAEAEAVLATEPGHLLALTAAAQAAHALGDVETARAFYQRLLDAFDAESARDLREYAEHAPLLPGLRDEARRYLGR